MKLFLFIILLPFYIYSQCSDAGVCSVAGHNVISDKNVKTGLSYVYGYSGKTDDIIYSSIVLEIDYNFLDNTSAYLSLPYSFQSGPSGEVSGIGDLLIILNQNIYKEDFLLLSIQGGMKFATGKDNAENLPLMYQSGLGSNDVILGASLTYDNINASVGYQIAGARNENILKVERGDDFLFSAGYNYLLSELLSSNIKLLVIKRLSETSTADSLNPGRFINVEESDNLQINAALAISWMISENAEINFFGAVPFKKRPVNIDGLTRSMSLSAGLLFHF